MGWGGWGSNDLQFLMSNCGLSRLPLAVVTFGEGGGGSGKGKVALTYFRGVTDF